MKKLVIFFVLGIIILFNSCCADNSEEITDKYVTAKVIIRAEKDHPVGLLKLVSIYKEDINIEQPSRGIIYKYLPGEVFDLFDTVYAKIYTQNGVDFADLVTKEAPAEDEKTTAAETHLIIQKLKLNLHNGDKHREGPKHIKLHYSGTGGVTQYNSTYGYFEIKMKDNMGGDERFMNIEPPRPIGIENPSNEFYSEFSRVANGLNVYKLTVQHNHE